VTPTLSLAAFQARETWLLVVPVERRPVTWEGGLVSLLVEHAPRSLYQPLAVPRTGSADQMSTRASYRLPW
jgi:hypothetical protein